MAPLNRLIIQTPPPSRAAVGPARSRRSEPALVPLGGGPLSPGLARLPASLGSNRPRETILPQKKPPPQMHPRIRDTRPRARAPRGAQSSGGVANGSQQVAPAIGWAEGWITHAEIEESCARWLGLGVEPYRGLPVSDRVRLLYADPANTSLAPIQ